MGKMLLVMSVLAGGILSAGAAELPAICIGSAEQSSSIVDHSAMGVPDMRSDQPMASMAGDSGHRALMTGMAQMNQQMDAGAEAEDMDVAFVCAMIPHH